MSSLSWGSKNSPAAPTTSATAPPSRGDHRRPAGDRLGRGKAEALAERRHRDHQGVGIEGRKDRVGYEAGEMNSTGELPRLHQRVQLLDVGVEAIALGIPGEDEIDVAQALVC